ncbi:MAG: hypothetical protein JW776_11245 [Candidatus Lokiarchaeota archaeon]|nr:hypothetical protein [Candidatus Lokiarchaeota archaeon]
MSHKKKHTRKRKTKKSKLYSYLFHISTQPRKFLQPYRTTYCYDSEEDRNQALVFLCPRREIKVWIDWTIGKIRNKQCRHVQKCLQHGGYITLYIHIVRVFNPDLMIPKPRCGNEFVLRDRIRPRAIVPVRIYHHNKIDLSRLNAVLQRLNRY